jgi:hypothetical protein
MMHDLPKEPTQQSQAARRAVLAAGLALTLDTSYSADGSDINISTVVTGSGDSTVTVTVTANDDGVNAAGGSSASAQSGAQGGGWAAVPAEASRSAPWEEN